MPQEIALYGDFSIDETLSYYGTLQGMSNKEIRTGRDYLLSFLDFHDESRRVKELSSGQQRRVSLAVALIHSPGLNFIPLLLQIHMFFLVSLIPTLIIQHRISHFRW